MAKPTKTKDIEEKDWYELYSKTPANIPKKDMTKVYDLAEKHLGLEPAEWDAYRHSLGSIESQGGKFTLNPSVMNYMAKGGSNDHYDGRYQLGKDAKTDAARFLGVPNPGHKDKYARKAFRDDPVLQEMFLVAYTIKNHQYMGNKGNNQKYDTKSYLTASKKKRMSLLGYAHNQGHGGTKKYIVTGVDTKDGNGTKGSAYGEELENAISTMNLDYQ
jgi:hypothetical protein